MEFAFKLTREDWKPFLKVANRRLTTLAKANRKLFVSNLVAWMALGFAIAAYAAMYRKYPYLTHDLNVVAATVIVGALLLVGSFIFKQWLYQTATISEAGVFLGSQTVEANPQTITFKSSFGTTTYQWDRFIHRAENEAHIYLFVDNALALIIPKSAVGSDERLAELRQWAQLGAP